MENKLFSTHTLELFRGYSCEDFVNDQVFRRLVKEPDSNSIIEQLKEQLPDKSADIELAFTILQELTANEFQQSHSIKQAQWERLLHKDKQIRRVVLFRIAASLLIVAGLSLTVLYYTEFRTRTEYFTPSDETLVENATLILQNGYKITLGNGKNTQITYAVDGSSIAVDDSVRIVQPSIFNGLNKVIIPYGKKSKVVLSDGTLVWLNSGSKLSYAPVFKGKTRDVFLDGEGYFEVSKSPDIPFIVHTDSFNIKVLGTKFNVRSYKNDSDINTVLFEGKVSLRETGKQVNRDLILYPDEKATLSEGKNGFEVTRPDDIKNFIAWIDGYLEFKNEDLSSVLKKVSMYYNIPIELRYHNKINNIYGKLDLKENPEIVLDVLALISRTRYTRLDGKYLFND